MATSSNKPAAKPNTPDAPKPDLSADVRAALIEIDGAITGHTGNNLIENAYRHQGFRLSIAEVMDWLATGQRLYDGPSRVEFAGMNKVTNEQRASWYHVPSRARAAMRVAATFARYGLPEGEDHPILIAPGQAETKAALSFPDPLAKLLEIHAEARKQEEKRVKEEKEHRIKEAVKTAQQVTKFGGDAALVWASALEQGADLAELTQAWTNAGMTAPTSPTSAE